MTPVELAPVAPTPLWPMYRALVGTGLACALLIVGVYEATRPAIRRNRIEARRGAVLDVLPDAVESRAFRWSQAGSYAPVPDDSVGASLVFAGFDDAGTLVGVALEASGMGYQDVVRVLFGYSFEQQAIVGVRVLESRETPGLGDRVENDERWLENFESLTVELAAGGTALLHGIEFVKRGDKRDAWQIEGITGATITSRAIAEMLAASAAERIPRIAAHRADFAQEPGR